MRIRAVRLYGITVTALAAVGRFLTTCYGNLLPCSCAGERRPMIQGKRGLRRMLR